MTNSYENEVVIEEVLRGNCCLRKGFLVLCCFLTTNMETLLSFLSLRDKHIVGYVDDRGIWGMLHYMHNQRKRDALIETLGSNFDHLFLHIFYLLPNFQSICVLNG